MGRPSRVNFMVAVVKGIWNIERELSMMWGQMIAESVSRSEAELMVTTWWFKKIDVQSEYLFISSSSTLIWWTAVMYYKFIHFSQKVQYPLISSLPPPYCHSSQIGPCDRLITYVISDSLNFSAVWMPHMWVEMFPSLQIFLQQYFNTLWYWYAKSRSAKAKFALPAIMKPRSLSFDKKYL